MARVGTDALGLYNRHRAFRSCPQRPIFSIALSVAFLALVLDEVLLHEVLKRWTREDLGHQVGQVLLAWNVNCPEDVLVAEKTYEFLTAVDVLETSLRS